jgi:ATP-dependent protease HslVU (ClpYQ) ATPase subunit
MEEVLRDPLFEAPERSGTRVVVTRDVVRDRLAAVETRDLVIE